MAEKRCVFWTVLRNTATPKSGERMYWARAREEYLHPPPLAGGSARRATHGRKVRGHRTFMPTQILRTTERHLHGVSERTLQQQARDGMLERLAPGQYLVVEDVTPEQRWLARLDANLRRAPAGSAISHRAAARLHGLEGFTTGPRHEDISVPTNSGWRTRPAIRCGAVGDADVVFINGLRVTSVVATLADLGRIVGPDELEFAVEHALRGDDRRKPDVWNTDLLKDLQRRASERNLPSLRTLRVVLDRRGDQRPCGSYAETLIAQAMRRRSISLTRQPTVVVYNGRQKRSYFPDFADLRRRILIEIDGAIGHAGDEKWERDDRRQNDLVRGFRVVRFHARKVLADPDAVADEIGRLLSVTPERADRWTSFGADVTIVGQSATVRF